MANSKALGNVFKLSSIVNVKDPIFGAVCDGVTDDTAAITAAIAAMPDIGGTLHYSGTPLISSSITVNKKIRLVGDGGAGTTTTDLPPSYFIKKATMTTEALILATSGIIMEGGGVVGQTGNTGDNILVSGNFITLRSVTSTKAGSVGIRVGADAGVNANKWRLDDCRSFSNGSHGFYISDNVSTALTDANAGLATGCFSQLNGGDGFRNNFACHNTFVGCLGETNTGYGMHMMAGFNNWVIGGDYEANTAGQTIFDSTAKQCGEMLSISDQTITDNGHLTRRLGAYQANRVAWTPGLLNANSASKTITANSVSAGVNTAESVAHGYSTGVMVNITGNSAANINLDGNYIITVDDVDHFHYTYRTDRSFTTPTSGSGLTVAAKAIGTYTTAAGWYQLHHGRVDFEFYIVTSDITNISMAGTVSILLPLPGANLTNGFAVFDIGYYKGVTHTGKIAALLTQNGALSAPIYDTIGSASSPAALQGNTALATVTTMIVRGSYFL